MAQVVPNGACKHVRNRNPPPTRGFTNPICKSSGDCGRIGDSEVDPKYGSLQGLFDLGLRVVARESVYEHKVLSFILAVRPTK